MNQSESLYQIMYLSSATTELNGDALMKLLEGSRERNARKGITGLMLFADGSILHIIEGKETVIKELFEKIQSDSRHRGLQVLWSKTIPKRDFPDYKMGFRRTDQSELVDNIPGFSAIIENRQIPESMLKSLSKQVAIFIKSFAKSTRFED
ncbi:BLUF domain-containing protein [Coraliomargarita parva]|uniref:BLUF domain-containing protein n=1 Tax=Coraliomargarita parva TaxID=3014050 RepID=UPI0022B4CF2B|nr:BLUF domain-containing protein [Coraliomargarita parva]